MNLTESYVTDGDAGADRGIRSGAGAGHIVFIVSTSDLDQSCFQIFYVAAAHGKCTSGPRKTQLSKPYMIAVHV
jgi:hypothetical protein